MGCAASSDIKDVHADKKSELNRGDNSAGPPAQYEEGAPLAGESSLVRPFEASFVDERAATPDSRKPSFIQAAVNRAVRFAEAPFVEPVQRINSVASRLLLRQPTGRRKICLADKDEKDQKEFRASEDKPSAKVKTLPSANSEYRKVTDKVKPALKNSPSGNHYIPVPRPTSTMLLKKLMDEDDEDEPQASLVGVGSGEPEPRKSQGGSNSLKATPVNGGGGSGSPKPNSSNLIKLPDLGKPKNGQGIGSGKFEDPPFDPYSAKPSSPLGGSKQGSPSVSQSGRMSKQNSRKDANALMRVVTAVSRVDSAGKKDHGEAGSSKKIKKGISFKKGQAHEKQKTSSYKRPATGNQPPEMPDDDDEDDEPSGIPAIRKGISFKDQGDEDEPETKMVASFKRAPTGRRPGAPMPDDDDEDDETSGIPAIHKDQGDEDEPETKMVASFKRAPTGRRPGAPMPDDDDEDDEPSGIPAIHKGISFKDQGDEDQPETKMVASFKRDDDEDEPILHIAAPPKAPANNPTQVSSERSIASKTVAGKRFPVLGISKSKRVASAAPAHPSFDPDDDDQSEQRPSTGNQPAKVVKRNEDPAHVQRAKEEASRIAQDVYNSRVAATSRSSQSSSPKAGFAPRSIQNGSSMMQVEAQNQGLQRSRLQGNVLSPKSPSTPGTFENSVMKMLSSPNAADIDIDPRGEMLEERSSYRPSLPAISGPSIPPPLSTSTPPPLSTSTPPRAIAQPVPTIRGQVMPLQPLQQPGGAMMQGGMMPQQYMMQQQQQIYPMAQLQGLMMVPHQYPGMVMMRASPHGQGPPQRMMPMRPMMIMMMQPGSPHGSQHGSPMHSSSMRGMPGKPGRDADLPHSNSGKGVEFADPAPQQNSAQLQDSPSARRRGVSWAGNQ